MVIPTPASELADHLAARGISRRRFLRFCAAATAALGLPSHQAAALAAALERARRPSVIWLSFQECTGCTESLTRSHAPTLEGLILEVVSLDYHHTLQAAAGDAAEAARERAMHEHAGEYLVVVDGSIPGPRANPGFSTVAGHSNYATLMDTVAHAAAVFAVGSCAAFGGLPGARPNPTGARAVMDLVKDKPIVNISGCPPLPMAIAGALAHYIAFGRLPECDRAGRPLAFFGQSIHDRCQRRPFYDRGLFAERFDDEGARRGWCLYRLGCKGPLAYNACATMRWNDGTSWPVAAGHPCLGCSEPRFWDAGDFYAPLSVPFGAPAGVAVGAGVAGVALGGAAAMLARQRTMTEQAARQPVTVEELEARQ